MRTLFRPVPTDREVKIDPNQVFNCKISKQGTIEYTNHIFCDITGYEEFELIGESIEVILHPDMPNILFEVLVDRMEKGQPMQIIAKYMAKDGRYYWLKTDFTTKKDEKDNILAHYSESVAAPLFTVNKIKTLYKILSKIEEKTGNTKASERYLVGYLEERDVDYDRFVEGITPKNPIEQDSFGLNHQHNVEKERNTINEQISANTSLNFTIPQKKKIKKPGLFRRIFGGW